MKTLVEVKSETVSIKIKKINLDDDEEYNKTKMFQLPESSIAFFESVDIFAKAALKIEWRTNPRQRGQHLVHVPSLMPSDIHKIFHDVFLIDQVNFLLNKTKNRSTL